MKMKKTILFKLSLIVLAILIASCGKDGKNGNCYMSVSKGGMCITSYWDDNSCLPSPCNYDQNYGPCNLNSQDVVKYNYSFYFCSGSGYTGTYAIGYSLANGTKGSFLSNGKDGDDKYFTMTMGNGGLTTTTRSLKLNPKTIISAFDTTKTDIDTCIDFGNSSMRITGKKVWQKPGEIIKSKMVN